MLLAGFHYAVSTLRAALYYLLDFLRFHSAWCLIFALCGTWQSSRVSLRQRGATRLRQLHRGPRAGQEAHGAEQHPRPRGVYMPNVQHGGRGDAPEAGRGGAQPQRDAAVRGREPGQGQAQR